MLIPPYRLLNVVCYCCETLEINDDLRKTITKHENYLYLFAITGFVAWLASITEPSMVTMRTDSATDSGEALANDKPAARSTQAIDRSFVRYAKLGQKAGVKRGSAKCNAV